MIYRHGLVDDILLMCLRHGYSYLFRTEDALGAIRTVGTLEVEHWIVVRIFSTHPCVLGQSCAGSKWRLMHVLILPARKDIGEPQRLILQIGKKRGYVRCL